MVLSSAVSSKPRDEPGTLRPAGFVTCLRRPLASSGWNGLQRRAIPVAERCCPCVRAVDELHNGSLRRGGRPHCFIGEDEFAKLRVVVRTSRFDGGVLETLRLGNRVRVESGLQDRPASWPEAVADHL